MEIESAVESIGERGKILSCVFSEVESMVTPAQTGFEVSIGKRIRAALGNKPSFRQRSVEQADCAIAELERHYQTMIDNESNSKVFSLADFHFHRTIARATGNTFIARISELLTNVLINHLAHLNKSIGSNNGLNYHKLILDAVKSNDKELAVLIMRRHIAVTIEQVSRLSLPPDKPMAVVAK
ncbi:hypothetical protein FACS1894158_19080 [Betaproteobacteria bacterium]|nr:hypothetical protein FACS1894158_19080 [Betaproteobacteria bacterium]